MVGLLIGVCEAVGMSRPCTLFWSHGPRPTTGWTDPERGGPYVYHTATRQGLGWRVPDAPFVTETFCRATMTSSGYSAEAARQIEPVLLSPRDDAAEAAGLWSYRPALDAFCARIEADGVGRATTTSAR